MAAGLAEVRNGSPNATDEELLALARMYRNGISPGDEYAYAKMNLEVDVRHVYSAIAVPTLVLHNAEDNWVPVERGRELAELIPGSTYVEVPIRGHIPALADMEAFLDPIESFLHDTWRSDVTPEPDRVLATVLFTDIVGSTEKMSDARRCGLAGAAPAPPRGRSRVSSRVGAAARLTPRETDSSPPSTARPVPSVVPRRSSTASASSASTSAPGCTRANASSSTARSPGSQFTRAPGSAAYAEAGEVLVSSTVKDLVAGSGLEFVDRGVHGSAGEWRLYAAV